MFDILQIRFREDVACFLVCNSPISDIAKHAEPGNHFFLRGWEGAGDLATPLFLLVSKFKKVFLKIDSHY